MCAVLQAHEVEGCSLPANISDRANLTVAGQALTALGDSATELFGSHGTILLPNDAAFTALVTALGEFQHRAAAVWSCRALYRSACARTLLQIGWRSRMLGCAGRSMAAVAWPERHQITSDSVKTCQL
jgi:hypothetical protein